jgi:hypothetical protein
VTADRGWKRRFDDPIPLPRGRQLVTLQDAGSYITKLPKAEHDADEWQAAMEVLLLVVELDGPTMFARIGVMRALNHHVERAERFIADLREMITEAIANPVSAIDQHGQCLQRIAATLDAVPFVTMHNMANLDAAWRGRLHGMTFMSVIEVYLMCAGGGPTLDYADATAFLAVFERMVEQAHRQRLQ